jgi:hypothetical protein
MSFKKVYQYLYFALFNRSLKNFGEKDHPKFTALLVLSFLVSLNTLSFVVAFLICCSDTLFANSINNFLVNKLFIIIWGIVVVCFNFFYLQYNGKHKLIVDYFEQLNTLQLRKYRVIYKTYIFGTWILFIVLLILLAQIMTK